MSDRPVLFSASMVRALLDGGKTQTRRIIKPQPPEKAVVAGVFGGGMFGWMAGQPHDLDSWEFLGDFKTKFAPEDRLWVRESWKPHSLYDHLPPREMPQTKVFYLADEGYSPSGSRGRPGIHMPRWASRLTLIVTDVRVERLQDISETDAIAEGCGQYSSSTKLSRPFNPDWKGNYREGYAELWNQINGTGAWETNPWVAAYTFTIHHGNIDQIGGAA